MRGTSKDRQPVSSSSRKGTAARILKPITFFSSRWFLGGTFTLLLLIALALGQETYRKYQITQEIQQQRQSIQQLSRENQDLEDLVSYLQTDNYRERVARERLGLQRDGELVVVVPEEDAVLVPEEDPLLLERTNPERWWRYFFAT